MCSQCEELLEEIRETQQEISELRQDIRLMSVYRDKLIMVINQTRRNLSTILQRARDEMASCPKMRYAYLKGVTEAAGAIFLWRYRG